MDTLQQLSLPLVVLWLVTIAIWVPYRRRHPATALRAVLSLQVAAIALIAFVSFVHGELLDHTCKKGVSDGSNPFGRWSVGH